MKLLLGDCLDKLKELGDNTVDSIVTDPPYGLSFMGKRWDYDVPSTDIWKECLRVLKPGGHLLAFAGSRTYHRMAVRIEDAGFEIRDQIMWIYGSGFPKSHNIGKATDDEKWKGWGTALKPAHEPIVMARKPIRGTVADNVEEWGVGGLNIDECRISGDPIQVNVRYKDDIQSDGWGTKRCETELQNVGRFPANVIIDAEAGKMLDEQSGMGASRFFYCPKTSKSDRNEGLDSFESKRASSMPGRRNPDDMSQSKTDNDVTGRFVTAKKNIHPTVKPTDLMEYLIRLVTPKGGIVLDPFTGSGSTGKAAVRGGWDFIGIEREREYYDIATARMQWETEHPTIDGKRSDPNPVTKEKINRFFE